MICTGVSRVMLNYRKPDQRELALMTLSEARRYLAQGHFGEGSMKPKIESAIDYLKAVDGRVIITCPEEMEDALAGRAGTRITRR